MRIILEVCPRVTREGGADRLPGISLLPPTCAHMALWSTSLWIWWSLCEVIMMIIIWHDDHHLTIRCSTWFWSLHMRTGWMNFVHPTCLPHVCQSKYDDHLIYILWCDDPLITLYWLSGQRVLMECLSPSSPAAWPTFAPNMTFATQLPLKKRQKKKQNFDEA